MYSCCIDSVQMFVLVWTNALADVHSNENVYHTDINIYVSLNRFFLKKRLINVFYNLFI